MVLVYFVVVCFRKELLRGPFMQVSDRKSHVERKVAVDFLG